MAKAARFLWTFAVLMLAAPLTASAQGPIGGLLETVGDTLGGITNEPCAAPELDPGTGAAAFALLMLGALIALDRRRRQS